MAMASFKAWYMDLYWKSDNLFLEAAKFFSITYHEFELISLRVVWPVITVLMAVVIVKLWCDKLRLVALAKSQLSSPLT